MVTAVIRVLGTGTVLVALALTGCVSTVDGVAVRTQGEPPAATLLGEDDLDPILLGEAELVDTFGGTRIEVVRDLYAMADDSDEISAPECIGAIYTAEELAYAGTDYTAVLRRVATEPDDELGLWIEQAVVALPSAGAAEDFLDESARIWSDCSAAPLTLTDGTDWLDVVLDDVVHEGPVISQMSRLADFGPAECQHSMAAVENAIVETSVCGVRIRDEATALINSMLVNAGEQ